jgi:hypothetical protein
VIDKDFGDALQSSSSRNLHAAPIGRSRQYWGAFTGFDTTHRGKETATNGLRTVEQFQQGLATSFREMTQPYFDADVNLFFLTAWNQWNDQAILEPDEKHKSTYLVSMQNKLQTIPVRAATTKPVFVYHAGPALTGVTGIQCEAVKRLDVLLKDGIEYLGGSGPSECLKGGSPLPFNVQYLSQCSTASNACRAKSDSFSAYVERLRSQKVTPMMSEVVKNGPINEFLSSIRRGWHVRVILTYRRYHEWLPDLYGNLYPVESDRYKGWPIANEKSVIIPSFPDFYRSMNPSNKINQLREVKPQRDLMDYIERYREDFDEVRIFNMHDGTAGMEGSNRAFFCQMLPESPHACESFSSEPLSNSLDYLADAKSLYLADRLAVGAYIRGWVHRSLLRDDIRNAVRERLAQSNETLPLECLSVQEAQGFLNYSVTMEQKVVPTFSASAVGISVLQSDFFASLKQNTFCSEDINRMLGSSGDWQEFFQSLNKPRFVGGTKGATSQLHVVISHCDKPMNWVWDVYLAGETVRSMTIFSKCGQSIDEATLPPNTHVVLLPNVGRHDHSYAYWIANVFEDVDKNDVAASHPLPHDYMKIMTTNDLVMFINDDENPAEESSETRRPWKELLKETIVNEGFACGTRIDLKEDVTTLNVASKKNIGLFQMNEYGRAHKGFKSPYSTLEEYVSTLPVDLSLGNQAALNALQIKTDGKLREELRGTPRYEEVSGRLDLFMPVCYGGHFVASVDRIAQSPVGSWGTITKSLSRGEDIEEPHYMERIWSALLSQPLLRKQELDIIDQDFDVIRRRGRYKGLVTIPKPKRV